MATFSATRKYLGELLKWDARTVSKRLNELGITHSGALSHGELCRFLKVHYPEKVPVEYLQYEQLQLTFSKNTHTH